MLEHSFSYLAFKEIKLIFITIKAIDQLLLLLLDQRYIKIYLNNYKLIILDLKR